MSFFDAYPRFLETSRSGHAARLNWRHSVVIEPCVSALAGKRVIDVASHDGRWAFAAIQAGAEFVLGLEVREEMVRDARDTFQEYGIEPERYEFRCVDALAELRSMAAIGESARFDTALLLGFLYHTTRHEQLLADLASLGCTDMVVETQVIPDEVRPLVIYRIEETSDPRNAVSSLGNSAIVAHPSAAAVEMLVTSLGFEPKRLELGRVPDDPSLGDFARGERAAWWASRAPTR